MSEEMLVLYGDPLVGVVLKAVDNGCVAPEVKRVMVDQAGWSVWCVTDRKHPGGGGYRPLYHLHGGEILEGLGEKKQIVMGLIEKLVRHYDEKELWKLEGYQGW